MITSALPLAGAISEDGALWRAAPYVRISKEDGDKEESDSIGNQKDLIQSFARSRPDIALAEKPYVDDGYSGVNFDRPDFNRLMDDIRSGLINCVIVKDLSRLGRNYIETGKLLERFFPFMGVRFIAINDSYDSQNHNAQTDSLLIPFKNLINDAYCADTSRKIRSQLEVKREKGEFIGSFAAYGYHKDPEDHNRLLIDEPAAAAVRDIFRWKIEGMSPQAIADRLNGLGVLSPLEYKKQNGSKYRTKFQTKAAAKWSPVAVGRILKSELYIGVLTQGISTTPNYKVKQRVTKAPDEWARVEGSHEPIVTAEDFALVASLLRRDTRAGVGETAVYLFSGMLTCADCGRNLVRKNVGKYVYHVCGANKKTGACTSHSISDKSLYDAVYHTLTAHIRECAEIGRVLSFIENMPLQRLEAQKLQRLIGGKQTEIEKLKDRKVKLHGDYSDGLMDKTEFVDLNKIYTAHIKEAEAALVRLEQELDDILGNRTDKSLWIEHFKKYHNMQCLTRAAVVELIERITVYEGGRIEVIPRYWQDYDAAVRYISSLSLDAGTERRVG
jgi:DNA invertase Pin-like site-specific DNA recombinase